MKNNRKTGATYEEIASVYLEQHGYQILERNFRCREGEIDLICRKMDTLVFVEVKYRSGSSMGYPEEAVDIRKQKRISRCAFVYLSKKRGTHLQPRFDVIAISEGQIRHYIHAFEYIG